MPAAAKEEMLASPSAEEIFSLAAGVAAALEMLDAANAARGKKTHQGIFPKNRRLRVRSTWVKWSGTHQDRGLTWSETVLGPTIYLYDGDNLLEEVDNSGNIPARYTFGGLDQPLSELRSGTTSYYEADGLGSVTSLSNATGALAETYTYDAFGKLTASSGSITNPFQFTSREFDPEIGIYGYRARYLDQNLGRFISEDPARFGTSNNFYPYVSNRPTRFVDPTGLAQCLYQVGTHSLTCVSTENPANQITIDASTSHSGAGWCKDKNSCEALPFVGPIPPGKYRMNKDDRPGHDTWYRLEPIPAVTWWQYYSGMRRAGLALHLGHISEGCINVDKDNPGAASQYQRLLQMLDSEQDENYMFVEP
jgi:RHS repeat-associated protein